MSSKQDRNKDDGIVALIAGAGVGAYGVTLAVTAGVICPSCVIAAPALLGYGAYKKYKFKTEDASENPLQNAKNSDN